MVKSRIMRATAVALTSVGLIAGFSGIAGASSGSINNTGPDSSNKILWLTKNKVTVENNNHVSLMNQNDQSATSGSANVSENTTGGSATTGNATTNNSTKVSLSINNDMPGMGGGSSGVSNASITKTGPSSDNKVMSIVKNSVNVQNNNSICITNTNEQSATTGDANVSNNTTGGSATTGSATTNNSSTFNLSVNNN